MALLTRKHTKLRGASVMLVLAQRIYAQDDDRSTSWGSSSSARTIAGAIIGVLLGLLVLAFTFIVYRRHTRIYGSPQRPFVELRRMSSYVSVFTRRQNAELGARDQGPGYSAPPYSAQPPPYVGPGHERELDRKRDGDAGCDADLFPKHGNASVDVVDAEGRYEYDVPPPPPSPRTVSSPSTTPPPLPPTPPNEHVVHNTWYWQGHP